MIVSKYDILKKSKRFNVKTHNLFDLNSENLPVVENNATLTKCKKKQKQVNMFFFFLILMKNPIIHLFSCQALKLHV